MTTVGSVSTATSAPQLLQEALAVIEVVGEYEPGEADRYGLRLVQRPGRAPTAYTGRLVRTRHGRRLHLHPASTGEAIRDAAISLDGPQLTDLQIARQLAAAGLLRTEPGTADRIRYAVVVQDGTGRQVRGWDVDLAALYAAAPAVPTPPASTLRPRPRRDLLPDSPVQDPLSGDAHCRGGWARAAVRWPAQRRRRPYTADPLLFEFDSTVWPPLPVREHPLVEVRRAMSGVAAPESAPWEWPTDPAEQHDWYRAASDVWRDAIVRQQQLMHGIIASLHQLHAYGFPWVSLDLHLVPTSPEERTRAAAGDFDPPKLAGWVRREGDRWDNPIARYGWLARLSRQDSAVEDAAARELVLLAHGLCQGGWSLPKLVATVEPTLTVSQIRREWQRWRRIWPTPGPTQPADSIRAQLRAAAGLPDHRDTLRVV